MRDQITVQVLHKSTEYIKVKLPFIKMPVKMSHDFFKQRVKTGYFKIKNLSKLPDEMKLFIKKYHAKFRRKY